MCTEITKTLCFFPDTQNRQWRLRKTFVDFSVHLRLATFNRRNIHFLPRCWSCALRRLRCFPSVIWKQIYIFLLVHSRGLVWDLSCRLDGPLLSGVVFRETYHSLGVLAGSHRQRKCRNRCALVAVWCVNITALWWISVHFQCGNLEFSVWTICAVEIWENLFPIFRRIQPCNKLFVAGHAWFLRREEMISQTYKMQVHQWLDVHLIISQD